MPIQSRKVAFLKYYKQGTNQITQGAVVLVARGSIKQSQFSTR